MHPVPCAKVLGGARGRVRAFRPQSVVNVSGMSFGSLSGPAVEALNRGCRIAGCLQSTGEGGISRYHLHGGELVWQIGTGYFGCREPDGRFSMARLKERVAATPGIRAIEIKLSQGAKPGVGLPVGIKSAVGDSHFWRELATKMASGARAVDFTIDGGEGGTGAGPLVFTDHVALPFKVGFARVHKVFVEEGVHERVVFVGSGKLGFPEEALFAFARACGVVHPALVHAGQLELLDGRFCSKTVAELFGYVPDYGLPSAADRETIRLLMASGAPAASGTVVK